MSFDALRETLNLVLSQDQLRACRYLERQGFRFCVDFGYDNAVAIAQEHWRNRN